MPYKASGLLMCVIFASVLAAPASAADVSTSPVFNFDDVEVDGSSILVRTDENVGYTLNTKELEKRAAYTNWWVTFNNPELCATACECGAVDFGDPVNVGVGVFWATGRVIDRFGQAVFAADVAYGELPAGDDQVPFGDFARPIEEGAEIHIIVRSHGLPITSLLEEQLTSFDGACDIRNCADVQFSVHPSPTCTP